MSIFKSGNPTLSENKFRSTQIPTDITDMNAMTRQGTMQKFGFMLLLLMGSALYSWKEFNDSAGTSSQLLPLILVGAIGGLVIAIILMFKQNWAPFLAPIYALLEGLFIGAISAQYDYVFPGLVANAVGLTFGVGIAMYLLYQFGIIKATERFKSIVFTATAGLAIFYLAVWVLGMFGVTQLHFIHEGGTFGILFSVFVVAIASLNLILDFDMIDQGASMGAPKYMEWYGAFGLMVTFVWLYLEILRLLAKLNSRD